MQDQSRAHKGPAVQKGAKWGSSYTIATLWANCRDKLTMLAIPPALPPQRSPSKEPLMSPPSTNSCLPLRLLCRLSVPLQPAYAVPKEMLLLWGLCFALKTLSNFVVAFVLRGKLANSLTAPNAISPCALKHITKLSTQGGGGRSDRGSVLWANYRLNLIEISDKPIAIAPQLGRQLKTFSTRLVGCQKQYGD